MLFQYEDIEVRVRRGKQMLEILDIRRWYIHLASAVLCFPHTFLSVKLCTSRIFSISLSSTSFNPILCFCNKLRSNETTSAVHVPFITAAVPPAKITTRLSRYDLLPGFNLHVSAPWSKIFSTMEPKHPNLRLVSRYSISRFVPIIGIGMKG